MWGLQSLLLAEGRQVWTGNCLMHFGLAMWFLQWCNGKFAALEHPAEPKGAKYEHCASIWRTPIGRMLTQLEGASLEEVFQGYFGAVSPKPTGLLLAHGPQDFATFASMYKTQQYLPPPLKMGRSKLSDGDDAQYWATAQLKEYPRGLCRLLAGAFESWWLSACTVAHPFSPDPTLQAVYDSLTSNLGDGKLGPDFACPN